MITGKGCVYHMGSKRNFSVEYKKEIIKLVTEQGKKVAHVAKNICVS